MLWRCPACNRQTEEETCPHCQMSIGDGEPSAATGLLKETAGSVVFLIAVICFTAALLFSVATSWIPSRQVAIQDVKQVVTVFSDVTGTKMTATAWHAIHTLFTEYKNEMASSSGELPLLSVLVCIGLWLSLAQGYTARVNFRKGGPIVLKVATVMSEVAAAIVMVSGGVLCAGLWVKRPEIVLALDEMKGDAIATAIRDLMACEATMWLLLAFCGVLAVGGLLYLLFFISATRTVNGVLFTARTGDFGKRPRVFVGVMLCLASVGLLAESVWALSLGDIHGIGTALYAVSFLLFAIVLLRYRYRAYRLLWDQPAFTGEGTTAQPRIPTGIRVSDLMMERSKTTTVAPMIPLPKEGQNPQAPKRTLNEPFSEESLEPQPMTGNGCCPKCGTPIPDNAFFCLRCGHKFK